MVIRKSIVYTIVLLILVAGAGFFFFKSGSGSNVNDNDVKTITGDVQSVVLGFKNGNYYPNTVTVNSGKTVRISLDNSVGGCYRSFTVRQFGIAKYLASPRDYVEFTPTTPGTYRFACSMGMGTGTLIVK